MERLVAWYRVGSSRGALVALIVANLIPLFGVLILGWSVWLILILYWLENGIVGFFNVLKMSKAEGGDDGTDNARLRSVTIDGRSPVGMSRAVLIPFFCMHYGMFWLVHGLFVVLFLPLFGAADTGGDGNIGTNPDPGVLVFALIALLISHGISYLFNFIGAGEYKRTSPAAQMFQPYGRLMVLHVTIVIGAFAIAITGAAVAAVAVLVLLKIAMDIGFHLAEHRGDLVTATTSVPTV